MSESCSNPMRAAEVRPLLLAWAALMALSLVMAVAAKVAGASRPGAIALIVIAGAAAAKSRLVLRSYLGLARAPGALAGFFYALALLLALVAASFLIFPTPAARNGVQAQAKMSSSIAGAIE